MQESQEVVIPPAPSAGVGQSLESSQTQRIDHVIVKHAPAHDPHGHSTLLHEDHWLPAHKIIRTTCMLALLAWFVAIVLLSVVTGSMLMDTFVGLSPLILTIVVTYILVDRYHLESGFLMVFPFIFSGLLLLLYFTRLFPGIDYLTLAGVNIIIGLLFEAALVMQYSVLKRHARARTEKPKEQSKESIVIMESRKEQVLPEPIAVAKTEPKPAPLDEESVKQIVQSIEDKAKAINAVIGRVYSVRRGGTEGMRRKIRIDALHYNELGDLQNQPVEKRKELATTLLKKIRTTLSVLAKRERDVFDSDDIDGLVRVKHEKKGNDVIIDVLAANDSDPVKTYYESAREFCEARLKELE